jgi:hypothetical protein
MLAALLRAMESDSRGYKLNTSSTTSTLPHESRRARRSAVRAWTRVGPKEAFQQLELGVGLRRAGRTDDVPLGPAALTTRGAPPIVAREWATSRATRPANENRARATPDGVPAERRAGDPQRRVGGLRVAADGAHPGDAGAVAGTPSATVRPAGYAVGATTRAQGTGDTVSDAQVLETPAGLLSVWHLSSSTPGVTSTLLVKPLMPDPRLVVGLLSFTDRPWGSRHSRDRARRGQRKPRVRDAGSASTRDRLRRAGERAAAPAVLRSAARVGGTSRARCGHHETAR